MKKFFALLLTGALALGAAGCGSKTDKAADAEKPETTGAEAVTLKIGASPTPHAEILEAAKEELAAKGINLEIVEFTDYVQPNLALDTGDLDANYFQHAPYLDSFNEEHGTKLVSLGAVHYEPMGIYSKSIKDLAELPDGAKVGIPADGTNGGRALLLLEANGLIKLDPNAGTSATKLDIKENPKNIEIVEMEAAQLPLSIGDLSIAVINGNYAMQNGLKTEDALAIEAADSLAATTYANIIAVRAGDETRPELVTLLEVLNSQTISDYIKNTYGGAVAPTA
ncbi:MetQ/NlpA family ABC transporter substrate-binding protein [Anaerotignum propionicum]|jgi:D-methionine transport system substrate-binding protein|uniref:Lipoprotein n=1 Tax=Anaerotignum propionicum DSM 1682 TaxID=991789 RepID=A0A0X8VCE4_ANAPI|nr:MetQ/NlpA family ABC transporter substrate-binding protein [Anaerotignum propionicum]AMJ42450.1 membrane lipoprotein TpN32 precursor [Anaerotignum propionicum DSM 1682]SHE34229.1 D-methionine transport system substrate-binding protein [[Clostridium] propionicum DSM 1682] [Anaerotignum propionicum DSM 1682]